MLTTKLEEQLVPGGSYLFSGDITEASKALLLFDSIDSLVLDASESDAKSTRQFVAQAQLGAFGSKRLLLVTNAHSMSEIVQNTLLKLLEEPPSTAVILL